MQLILAIDSDPRRSEQLANLVRSRLEVELVQATSAGEALHALRDRIPDLILTSPLLSPFDDGVLDEYLRDLGTAATHVQTLRIPVLSSAPKKKTARSLFSLGRKKQTSSAAPDGCDPKVFADEIAHYLACVMQERSAGQVPAQTPTPAPGRVLDIQAFARPAKPEPEAVPVVEEFSEIAEPLDAEPLIAEPPAPPSQPLYVTDEIAEPRYVRDAWEPRYVREVAEPLRDLPESRYASEVPEPRYVSEVPEPRYVSEVPEPRYVRESAEPVYVDAAAEPVYVHPAPEPAYVRPEPEPVPEPRPEPRPVYARTAPRVEPVPAPIVEPKPVTPSTVTAAPAALTTGSITSFEAALAAIRAAWVKPEDQKPVGAAPVPPPAAPASEPQARGPVTSGLKPRAASGEVDLTNEIDALEDLDGTGAPAIGDSSADDSKAPASRQKVEKAKKRPEKPRARKARGAGDEWGVFDPNQCGFSALVDKLDEVTDVNEVTPRPARPRAASVGSRA